MLVRKVSPRGPMCFMCMMFSLSRPCEMLFLLLDLSCCECNVISLPFLCFSVNGFVCLACLTVFVYFLVKQFAIFCVWLLFCCLMLWRCLVEVEVLCWIHHVWSSQNVCVVSVIPMCI